MFQDDGKIIAILQFGDDFEKLRRDWTYHLSRIACLVSLVPLGGAFQSCTFVNILRISPTPSFLILFCVDITRSSRRALVLCFIFQLFHLTLYTLSVLRLALFALFHFQLVRQPDTLSSPIFPSLAININIDASSSLSSF